MESKQYPKLYIFDINRRVYEDGKSSPNYSKHFTEIVIIDENNKEYICQYSRTINKKSMLYKRDSSTRIKVFTDSEVIDDIYVYENRHKFSEIIKRLDANSLREVEKCLKNLTQE